MKKVSFIFLLSSMAIIIYLFVREQFNGIVLSEKENTLLSITYLVVGISLLILFRIKYQEDKNKKNSNK